MPDPGVRTKPPWVQICHPYLKKRPIYGYQISMFNKKNNNNDLIIVAVTAATIVAVTATVVVAVNGNTTAVTNLGKEVRRTRKKLAPYTG